MEGDSSILLGSPFHCLTILSMKKFFLMSSLVQLEAVTPGPVPCYLGVEATAQPGHSPLPSRQPTGYLEDCSRTRGEQVNQPSD